MNISKVSVPPESGKFKGLIDEEYFVGSLEDREIEAARRDPHAFLKTVGLDVSSDTKIELSINDIATRTLAHSKKEGTRPVKGGEKAARQGTISTGTLCRISVIRIDGVIIVHIVCIPVVVITCW